MSESSVAPKAPEKLPAYFQKNAADVSLTAWREYEPLVYEVWMLAEVTKKLDALPKDERLPAEHRSLKNALIETFALHFRNLAEFLWPNRISKKGNRRNPQPSDATVGCFTPRWTPAEPPGLNDLIERVSREIGHLTTHRRTGSDPLKHWDITQCIEAVRAPLIDLVTHAEKEGTLPPDLNREVFELVNLRPITRSYPMDQYNATSYHRALDIWP